MRLTDAIDRNALLAAYDAMHKGEPGRARKIIEDAPTVDAVPVVRCKDCKWRNEKWKIDDNYWCSMLKRYIWENFFCGFGDRRDAKE